MLLFYLFYLFFHVLCSSSCYVGDELECIQPSVYRNVARQLNISVAMESMVSDAFIGVATEIFSTGTCGVFFFFFWQNLDVAHCRLLSKR